MKYLKCSYGNKASLPERHPVCLKYKHMLCYVIAGIINK